MHIGTIGSLAHHPEPTVNLRVNVDALVFVDTMRKVFTLFFGMSIRTIFYFAGWPKFTSNFGRIFLFFVNLLFSGFF